MEGEYDGRDSGNLFIHGLLTGRGGSCVSMPALTVAIGRRLGYPLRLVNAKLHTFCRWDDPSSGERFNIDATLGFGEHPDSYYYSWPAKITAQEIDWGYLQSLTPRQEAAFFLSQRGVCWLDHLQFQQAVEELYAAHRLHPSFPEYRYTWGVALVMHRIFGDEVVGADHIDPEEITRRSDELVVEFGPSILKQARRELERIVTNWRTRPAFPPPRFDVPEHTAPAQRAT
jgi:hypothetical protein